MFDHPFAQPQRPEDDPLYEGWGPPIASAKELRDFVAARDDLRALEDLVDGDRLRLLLRVREWMDKRCFVLDLRSVVYGALPLIVAAAPTLLGTENLDEWLEGTIEVSADGLLERDALLAREAAVAEEPYEPRFAFMMDVLRFTPENVRVAVVAANELPAGERHVFYHCLVMGKGFGRYEEEVGIDAVRARSLLLRAVDKLSDAVGD